MEESTTIQGQTVLEVLSALLLTLITVYAYLCCRPSTHRTKAVQSKPAVAGQSMPCLTSLVEHQEPSSPSATRAVWEKHKSSIADWLAPLIAWFVVIWTVLAVVGILLGEG